MSRTFGRASAPYILLGDIGGTNARFALAPETGPIPPITVFRTADHPTLEAALGALLGPRPPALRGAAFSVAGPIRNGGVRMTNCPWMITQAGISAASGVASPILVNDFAALAQGLPSLDAADLRPVGPGDVRAAHGPIGVLGPGTGLGVSGLIPDGRGGYRAVAGEGGHVDLAPGNARELAVIGHLLAQGHVSAERVLSGAGLETLYETLATLDGAPARLAAPEIDKRAAAGTDPRAMEAIALFTSLLGRVAGDLALTLGATAIYLGGGILPRWTGLFDAQLFRSAFEAKGRFSSYMAAIPTAIVTAPDTAFRGLRRLVLEG